MKISLEWLKDYTDYQGTLTEFVDAMTMAGSKVETFEIEGRDLSHLVTGYIEDCVAHPDSDHLSVCRVDVGSEVKQIVCGAPNVRAGQKVIVALPGASLGKDFKIGKAKLRGVESDGMICSIDELGFSVHDFPGAAADGIYVLPEDTEVGVNALDVLGIGQEIVEFEITSNRPDCLSVEGLAREAAVVFGNSFKPIDKKPEHCSELKTEDIASVTNEASDLCSTFIGRVVTDIKIEQSPIWMQKRLRAAGMRPINNIVDITNFVMLSLGQPMHAYDLDFLNDHAIIVRRAEEGERMTLLDKTEITMNAENLVIADTKGPVALAGVMGALNSEVRDSTKSILFESANFDCHSVRSTAKKYNLRSESSLRFEKGLPIENAQRAIDYACYLIELLNCGKVASTQIVSGGILPEPHRILFDYRRLNKLIGLNLSAEEIIKILEDLEVSVQAKDNLYEAVIPAFRQDLQLEADLAEEVARIYGYNRIPGKFSKNNSRTLGGRSPGQKDLEKIHKIMNGCGAFETFTYTFVSPSQIDKLNLTEDDVLREELTILNPLGEEYSKMRTTVLPSLLQVVEYNLSHGNQEGLIYEIGKTYHPRGALGIKADEPQERDQILPDERQHLTLALFTANKKESAEGFFEVKGIMEELFRELGIEDYHLTRTDEHYPYLHPGQSALVYLPDYDYPIGYLGSIHPSLKQNFAVTDTVFVADLDLYLLLGAKRKAVSFQPLPKFPSSSRDLAFVMEQSVLVGDIERAITLLAGDLLVNIRLFDVYQGKGVEEGKKSVAFSLVFRSPERTLSDQDVNPIIEKIIVAMRKKGIELRS